MIGKNVNEFYVDPADKNTFMLQLMKNDSVLDYELNLRRKDRSMINVSASSHIIYGEDGKSKAIEGTLHDITGRKQAEEEREVLYAIAEAVNTTTDFNEFLQSIHSNIKQVMYAENCFIALYDAKTETISFPLFVDQLDSTPAPRRKRKGLTEYVLRTAKPLLLTPKLYNELVRSGDVEVIGSMNQSWLGVPLIIQSQPIGVIVIQSYEPGKTYGDREKDLLAVIGNQVATAIERKRAEEEKGRLFSILRASLNEIYVFDTNTLKFNYVNEATLHNIGYTFEEIKKLTLLDLKPEFTENTFREMVAPLLSGEKNVLVFQTVHRRKNASLYPVEVHLQIVQTGIEKVFLAVIYDITERKLAETRLRLESSALNAAANSIIITNRDGIIQLANSAFTALTGYTAEEAIGKNPRELIKSGLHDQSFYKDIWETILSGNMWRGEIINRRKNGTLYTEEQSITPVRNEHGEITHFIAIKQDITERKLSEEKLRQSEERFRTLFDQTLDGVYRSTHEGKFVDINPAFVKMFGYSSKEEMMNIDIKKNSTSHRKNAEVMFWIQGRKKLKSI